MTRDRTQSLLAELRPALSPEVAAVAMSRGQEPDLEGIVADVLAELTAAPNDRELGLGHTVNRPEVST